MEAMSVVAAKSYVSSAARECEDANYHDECRALYLLLEELDTLTEKTRIWFVGMDETHKILVDPTIVERPRIIKHTFYLHRSKDSNAEIWRVDLGLPENDAFNTFLYACCEVAIEAEIDTQTGDVTLLGIVE